jgi:hypothetical protein
MLPFLTRWRLCPSDEQTGSQLLQSGDFTSLRRLFAKIRVNE